MNWRRPLEQESAGYFTRYIMHVHEDNALHVLKVNKYKSLQLMTQLSTHEWDHRYADGKWSVKEVWIHILDTERIFAYRMLRVGRGDQTPLPGFEQDDYIIPSEANARSAVSIITEYEAVRNNTISLIENLPASAFDRMGTASKNPISCRSLAFIIAGHEIHHLKGLKENYQIG